MEHIEIMTLRSAKRTARRKAFFAIALALLGAEFLVLPHYFHLLDARYCPVPGEIDVRLGPLAQITDSEDPTLDLQALAAVLEGPAPTEIRGYEQGDSTLRLAVPEGEECHVGRELVRKLPNVFQQFQLSIMLPSSSGDFYWGCPGVRSRRPFFLGYLAHLILPGVDPSSPNGRESTFRVAQLRAPGGRPLECAEPDENLGLWPRWSF